MSYYSSLRIAAVSLFSIISCHAGADSLSPTQPPPEVMAKAAGVALPPYPWHMTDVWWNFQGPTEHFETFSQDVTIDRNIPSDYNLYVSPLGIAKMNGMQCYGGLQTNVNGWKSKDDHTRIFPGKGAIFSRWSDDKKTPIGLDEVRMAADGICESAGYEGSFCSVRRPFTWTKGTYTYSVVKGDTETVSGKPYTWFHCLITTHETGTVTWIGSLRFEGTDFTFWNQHASFLEVYSTKKNPASGIPKVIVTFGFPRINGAVPQAAKVSFNYNWKTSPACAKARVDGDKVVVEIGAIYKSGTETSAQLRPAPTS